MKKEMIEVDYARKQDWDFGLLGPKYRIGTIKVDKKFWMKYVNKRTEFEFAHHELIGKVRNKEGYHFR